MTERVWDRFLTERDKAHLALLPPPLHPGIGASPAVISIDNYLMAVGDRPRPLLESVEEWPSSMGLEGWEALSHTAHLLEVARAAGIPVIHANRQVEYDNPLAPEGAAKRHKRLCPDEFYERRFDFVEQASPIPGEMIIRKTSPSAFFNTPLARYLLKNKIDTLIVCGESASGCIRASVVDGFANGFRMIVVEECVYDRTEASRAMNLFDMDQKYGHVMALADVVKHLEN